VSEKKPWQKGYDLEFLKEIESFYADWNSYTLGPFAQYKKNNIAEDLSECRLQSNKNPDGSYKMF
jgi:hypothetical protein